MKYDLQAQWLYDTEIDPVSKRLATLLRSKYLGGCVIKPKSLKLAPTPKNIRDAIASQIRLPPARLDAVSQYNTKSLNLTVDVTPPCGVSRFPSSVQVTFSLGQTFAGGPFANVNDLRDLALACAKVGPCPWTFVNPRDINHGARLEVKRTTDTWAVPAAIEWITVLHQSIVDKMAVDLMKAETVPGVRVGQKGDFRWIILTSHPFQANSADDLRIQEQVAQAIDLPAIHARFPRPLQ
ncbi:MAG: hypothetical protein U0941_15820 [Planctomycetaceae bacterium]